MSATDLYRRRPSRLRSPVESRLLCVRMMSGCQAANVSASTSFGDTPTDVHDSIELLIKFILHSEVNVVARTRFG